jgi:hypothetical protein
MPFQVGSVAVHDDGQHSGSAKRDAILGVAGLSADGSVLSKGRSVYLTRDGNQEIKIIERTSDEIAFAMDRISSGVYVLYNGPVAGGKIIQDSSSRKTGSYTGDASVNRAIAHGVGTIPSRIRIYTSSAGPTLEDVLFSFPAAGSGLFKSAGGLTVPVTAVDATNFYVGNVTFLYGNENTVPYVWEAFP